MSQKHFQLQRLLEKSGLDEEEVRMYLALVELKQATASVLARKAGIARTLSYKYLENLIQKGLVKENDSTKIKQFSCTDFQAPLRLIEQQQLEMHQLHQEAKSIATRLQNISEPTREIPIVQEWKGIQGKESFWGLMRSSLSREIWVLNPPQAWLNFSFSDDFHKWHGVRRKKHIWERVFTSLSLENLNAYPVFTELYALVDEDNDYNTSSHMFLVDHYQVVVYCWDPFFAVCTDSNSLVNLLKLNLSNHKPWHVTGG